MQDWDVFCYLRYVSSLSPNMTSCTNIPIGSNALWEVHHLLFLTPYPFRGILTQHCVICKTDGPIFFLFFENSALLLNFLFQNGNFSSFRLIYNPSKNLCEKKKLKCIYLWSCQKYFINYHSSNLQICMQLHMHLSG